MPRWRRYAIRSARVIFGRCALRFCGVVGMQIDTGKIDEAVLALLYLTLHDGVRAWKSFDWDTMNRLHEKGFIVGADRKLTHLAR